MGHESEMIYDLFACSHPMIPGNMYVQIRDGVSTKPVCRLCRNARRVVERAALKPQCPECGSQYARPANWNGIRACRGCNTKFDKLGHRHVEKKDRPRGIPAGRITIGRGCNWKAGLGLD